MLSDPSVTAEQTGSLAETKLTPRKPSGFWVELGSQVILIIISLIVLFPIMWIVAMAIDPRNLTRPTLPPPGATLDAFVRIFTKPFANNVYFWDAFRNSLLVAGCTALIALVLSATAGYAFSRFRFPGRQAGMLSFIVVQMMPAGATLAPLLVLLSLVGIRRDLTGLMVAYASGAIPFLIWNLKGYFDTIPRDLEEAAMIDGATPMQAFLRVVLPLSLPAFVINTLFAFMAAWSEYIMAWTFLTDPKKFTLPMVLAGMVGQYASNTSWSEFAALSIVMSVPVVVFFFIAQRWIVSGLTVGGVKG